MRVVCDNCGAVYKIADSKLVKDVNKATCKRCGHKIIIYRPGNEATPAKTIPAPPPDDQDERTVIKNVPDLEKLNSSQSVPSIGSLTAELRAISVPGLKSPAPSAPPAVLGPAPPVSKPAMPAVPPPPPAAPAPLAGGAGGAAPSVPVAPPPPVVKPAVGIPPSDSPRTQVYKGPGPAPAAAPSPAPSVPPAGPKTPVVPPAVAKPAAPAPRPPAGPRPVVPPPPGAPAARPGPAVPPAEPVTAPGMPKVATKTAAVPAPGGAAALGAVAFVGAVGLVGAVVAVLAPGPIHAVALGMAGFGAGGALFISLLSDRGRKSDKTPLALILALVIGAAIAGMAFARSQGEPAPEPAPAVADPGPDAFGPSVVTPPAPTGQEDAPTPAEETPADPDGLSDEERAKVREFSSGDIAGLGRESESEPEPTPEPVREARRDPTPAPRAEPTPKPEKEPRNEMLSSGPAKPEPKPERKTEKKPKDDKPSLFVVDTIIRSSADIKRCIGVERARGTEVDGKIYMKFTIEPEGTVKRARVTTSRFQGTSLDKCLSREVNALKFPPFNGTAQTVSYALLVGS